MQCKHHKQQKEEEERLMGGGGGGAWGKRCYFIQNVQGKRALIEGHLDRDFRE